MIIDPTLLAQFGKNRKRNFPIIIHRKLHNLKISGIISPSVAKVDNICKYLGVKSNENNLKRVLLQKKYEKLTEKLKNSSQNQKISEIIL